MAGPAGPGPGVSGSGPRFGHGQAAGWCGPADPRQQAKLAERLSNEAGLVTGEVLDDATVFFAVLRIGYRPFLSQPVALGPGVPVSLAFNLASRAIPLPDLEVRAYYHTALDRTGFWEREREGFGHFVDPAVTERRRGTATHFLDYLTNIPGVSVYYAGAGRTFRFGTGSVLRGCGSPKIYVDGIKMDTGSIDTIIQPGDVLAMEVYRRPAELPAGYGGAESDCGVLLIWSRRGGRDQSSRSRVDSSASHLTHNSAGFRNS